MQAHQQFVLKVEFKKTQGYMIKHLQYQRKNMYDLKCFLSYVKNMKGYNHHKDQSTGETNNEQKFPNKEINIL